MQREQNATELQISMTNILRNYIDLLVKDDIKKDQSIVHTMQFNITKSKILTILSTLTPIYHLSYNMVYKIIWFIIK